jgi:zinc finger protein
MANPSLAQDLFADMGQKVAEASREGADDEEYKVVDEIESLCMNCHADVSLCPIHPIDTRTDSPRA